MARLDDFSALSTNSDIGALIVTWEGQILYLTFCFYIFLKTKWKIHFDQTERLVPNLSLIMSYYDNEIDILHPKKTFFAHFRYYAVIWQWDWYWPKWKCACVLIFLHICVITLWYDNEIDIDQSENVHVF